MKKAFTLLELVFVVVAIGILAAAIIPRINTNRIGEAAHQLVSHVRYTQHLAMSDDMYDSNDADWYLNKWQIIFEATANSNNEESYTIFSDYKGGSAGNADSMDEIAINPLNRSQRLSGGTDAIDIDNDPEATPNMNLGETYGITEVKVTGASTGSAAQRILFDNMGRPYRIGNAAMNSPLAGLATTPIFIKICTNGCSGADDTATNDDEAVIRIEEETGYACILQQNSNSICLDI